MLARVLLRNDFSAERMQPVIAVGVIEVPVRVDEVRDRFGAEIGECLGELGTRHADAGIDQYFAVRSGEDGDVAAGALQHADVVSQPVGDNGRHRGTVLDQADEAARLGERLARCKPSSRSSESRATQAAQAEVSSRQQILV
jgi:hypothetical protein